MTMKETELPPPEVKIFRIEKMKQEAWIKKYTGNFVGTIVFDRRQPDISKSMRIVLSNGTVVGYAPVSMLGELIIFVKHQDVSACKGHINAEYDSLKKQYYFWGECVVPKP